MSTREPTPPDPSNRVRAIVVVEYDPPEADSDAERERVDYINGEFEIVTDDPRFPEYTIMSVRFEDVE